MLYDIARSVLFRFNPETAHNLSLNTLSLGTKNPLTRRVFQRMATPVPGKQFTVMGLTFSNPVGLAAGMDKDADHIDALGQLGFGFIEVGTVTPKPQPGNPKPRLFRLPEVGAIINRMGFNNKGVDYLVKKVQAARYSGVLGINIGKNVTTPLERAHEDYLTCMQKVYPYAGYIAVNISSPNTPGLRNLQLADTLRPLLEQLKSEQNRLAEKHGQYVPLAVKIASDLTDSEIDAIAHLLQDVQIDGVIATNTTIERNAVADHKYGAETGGLSGAPLHAQSTHVIGRLHHTLQGSLPIIGVGGVMSGADARAKIEAGASLIQLYTGFIYKGPQLIHDAAHAIMTARSKQREPIS